jgi:hypothetical protein
MIDWVSIFTYGAIISLLSSLVILGIVAYNPRLLLRSYPPGCISSPWCIWNSYYVGSGFLRCRSYFISCTKRYEGASDK